MTEKLPMKYRRMEFNAQLQAENLKLLEENQELLKALKSTLAALDNVGMQDSYIDFDQVRTAKTKAALALAKATGIQS